MGEGFQKVNLQSINVYFLLKVNIHINDLVFNFSVTQIEPTVNDSQIQPEQNKVRLNQEKYYPQWRNILPQQLNPVIVSD